jgi:alpha-tubulin suppressor-like RCC1 family protein
MLAALLVTVLLSACGGGTSSTAVSSVSPASFYGHSVAFRNDTTMAWGNNGFGQLGNNSVNNSSVPVPVTGISGITGISAGGTHTLAFKNMSSVWAWGNNGFGQLGDGTSTARMTPVQVKTSESGNPLLTGVTAIAAGGSHSLALKSDGTVWAWGFNGFGQLGDNSGVNRSNPVQVKDTGPNGSTLPKVIAVAAGGSHSLALDINGNVWAWGYNGFGQLGDGTTSNRPFPASVSGLSGVIAIAAGGSHSLALTSDGKVWAWGYNGFGQLGVDPVQTPSSSTPLQVNGFTSFSVSVPSGVIPLTAGLDHSLAIDVNNNVWGWGYNGFGQLGDGATINTNNPDPAPVPTPRQVVVSGVPLAEVVAVTAIGHHTLATTGEGKVWAWGDNRFGQLGDGKEGLANSRSVPQLVSGF